MSASAHVPVSVDAYLTSAFQPDCDYVEGELQERDVGEIEHSEVQFALSLWFGRHQTDWNIRILPEVRIQVSETRFRVGDFCLVSNSSREARIVRTPPLVVIDILSPEDRVARCQERIDDFRRMGVGAIWVIDPLTRRGYDCSTGSWLETTSFAVPDSPIRLDLGELFAGLG
jgi:Uma2 family endonuclease